MPTADTKGERKRRLLLLALLVVAWLALRLPSLFRSLWFDEAFRTFVVLNPASIKNLLLHDVHNPLYNAFMYLWIRVFGDSEPSIRVPTLLAGAGVIGIVWVWCKSHWGERAAWWSAAWLVVNPVHAYYSCEAKNNMVTVLCAALALWRWDVLARELSVRSVVYAMVAGALAIWTDFQALLVLPAAWIAWMVLLARSSERRRGWTAALVCVGGTLLLVSPLLLFKAAHLDDLDRHYLRYFHVHEPLRLVLVFFSSGNGLFVTTRSNWPVAAVLFAPVVAPALVVGWLAVRQTSAGRVVLISVLAPMVMTFVGSEVVKLFNPHLHIYQERNLLVMMPGLAIALGVGMASLRRKSLVLVSRWGLLAMGLLSSIAFMTWNHERATISQHVRPDWRGAANLLHLSKGSDTQPMLVVSRSPLLAMRYYMPGDRVIELPMAPADAAVDDVTLAIRRLMVQHGAKVCWVIQSESWSPLRAEEMEDVRREFEVSEEQQVRGLLVWRVEEKM